MEPNSDPVEGVLAGLFHFPDSVSALTEEPDEENLSALL